MTLGKNACLNSVLLKVICSSKRITIFGNLLRLVLCCIDAEYENPFAEIHPRKSCHIDFCPNCVAVVHS